MMASACCRVLPDDSVQHLRDRFRGEPLDALPKAFLGHILQTKSWDAEFAPLVLVSDELGVHAHTELSKRPVAQPTRTRRRGDAIYEMVFAPRETRKVPWTFAEAAAAVETAWGQQRAAPFADVVYLVLVSPEDPDDYVAVGGKRLCKHARARGHHARGASHPMHAVTASAARHVLRFACRVSCGGPPSSRR